MVDWCDRYAMLAGSRIYGVPQNKVMIAVAFVGPSNDVARTNLGSPIIRFGVG